MSKKQPKRKPETWWCVQNGEGYLVSGTNGRNRSEAITLFVSPGSDEYGMPEVVKAEWWDYYSKQHGYRVVRIEVRRVESKQ